MLISPEEKRRRQSVIDFARGSVRFEGIILNDDIEAINQRYINGEIEMAEHTRLCLARIDAATAVPVKMAA